MHYTKIAIEQDETEQVVEIPASIARESQPTATRAGNALIPNAKASINQTKTSVPNANTNENQLPKNLKVTIGGVEVMPNDSDSECSIEEETSLNDAWTKPANIGSKQSQTGRIIYLRLFYYTEH